MEVITLKFGGNSLAIAVDFYGVLILAFRIDPPIVVVSAKENVRRIQSAVLGGMLGPQIYHALKPEPEHVFVENRRDRNDEGGSEAYDEGADEERSQISASSVTAYSGGVDDMTTEQKIRYLAAAGIVIPESNNFVVTFLKTVYSNRKIGVKIIRAVSNYIYRLLT